MPFHNAKQARTGTDELVGVALSRLSAAPTRFNDLRDQITKVRGSKPTRENLGDTLKELEWLGFINIINIGDDYLHWVVERNEP